MPKKLPDSQRRVMFTAKLDPDTELFIKRMSGSKGRCIDFIVKSIRRIPRQHIPVDILDVLCDAMPAPALSNTKPLSRPV